MCNICGRPDRADIERAVLSLDHVSDEAFEQLAEQYGCDVEELKAHAVLHTPMLDDKDTEDSLVRRVKLKEVDLLSEVCNEYLDTLKIMGKRIKKLTQESSHEFEAYDEHIVLAKCLTKPMVDMYLGLGSEIRQGVKTMTEIDRLLNGPEDPATTGMMALAQAIRGSGAE